MAEGRTNAGGGGFNKSVIIVTAPTGSTVTCTKGTTVKTATEKNGEWWFKNLDTGTWTVKATLSGQTATQTVNITQFGVYRIKLDFQLYPDDFDWSALGVKGTNYEIMQDDGTVINEEDYRKFKNWKAKVFTSGYITALKNGRIDLFLVGGGGGSGNDYGGGGGSGYTNTIRGLSVEKDRRYTVTIGSGGNKNSSKGGTGGTGGTTSAFDNSSNGGFGGKGYPACHGGNGGSGGGAAAGGKGGTDGNNGEKGNSIFDSRGGIGGTGQGSTTREFGDIDGALYATGGSAGSALAGSVNTGNGGSGGGSNNAGYSGGSGIVLLRNYRSF